MSRVHTFKKILNKPSVWVDTLNAMLCRRFSSRRFWSVIQVLGKYDVGFTICVIYAQSYHVHISESECMTFYFCTDRLFGYNAKYTRTFESILSISFRCESAFVSLTLYKGDSIVLIRHHGIIINVRNNNHLGSEVVMRKEV